MLRKVVFLLVVLALVLALSVPALASQNSKEEKQEKKACLAAGNTKAQCQAQEKAEDAPPTT